MNSSNTPRPATVGSPPSTSYAHGPAAALGDKPSRPDRRTRHRVLPGIAVGAIAGIDNIGVGLAIASLLFSGPLASGLGVGVGAVFLAATVLALCIGLGSGFRNAVGLVQESSVAVLAATLVATLSQMPGDASARVATALAIIGMSSIVTGLILWTTGALQLGRFVRLLPYPVVAGFVAASGWLLVEGALTIMAPESGHLLLRVAPGAAFAAILFLALRLVRGNYTAPITLLGAIAAFYTLLFLTGTNLDAARDLGLLPTLGDGDIALPTTALIRQIDWGVVLTAGPGMVAVAAIGLIGVLLNTGGLELATGLEVDPNRELRVAGWSNILAGAAGGPSGYVGLSMTVLAEKVGALGREAGVATAITLFAGLLFAGPLVSHIPVFVTSGLVLFLGIELLFEWLLRTRSRLPANEWAVVLLITAVVAASGFLQGLAVGILVSAGLFIYNYSRLPVVRQFANGRELRSAVDRSPAASTILDRYGDTTAIVSLQGYLFFGTADQIVELARRRARDESLTPLGRLIIDLRHVSGIDSSAVASFVKIEKLATQRDFDVILTHLPDRLSMHLDQAGLDITGRGRIRTERDLDHALESCEDYILRDFPDDAAGGDIVACLQEMIGNHRRLPDLVGVMERMELAPGNRLIRAGDSADDVFLVAQGWVSVRIRLSAERELRMRSMTAGAVVGEIAQYLGKQRTADVICERETVVYKMARAVLERIERDDSELAALFHRLVAIGLSDKLDIANRMVRVAQH